MIHGFRGGNTVAIRSFTVLLPYCYRIAIGEALEVKNDWKAFMLLIFSMIMGCYA